MAQHEPRPGRIAMPTQRDDRVIIDANFVSGKRLRYVPSRGQWESGANSWAMAAANWSLPRSSSRQRTVGICGN